MLRMMLDVDTWSIVLMKFEVSENAYGNREKTEQVPGCLKDSRIPVQ